MLCYATAKLLRDEAESMGPNIDPEQVRKLDGWELTQNDRAPFAGWCPSSAWVSNHFYPLRRLVIRNPVEQCHGTQCNPLYMKDLWPSASQFWKIIPDLKAVNNPDLTHSDPKIRGKEPKTLSKRAHNFWTHAHLTPATLGIALLFLPMWSPDLKLVERRCQDKFHCAWAER